MVDSTPVQLKPGATDVQLTATLAKTAQEAAKVYPADYWLSLLEPPAATEFPGTGPDGNGIGRTMLTQNHYIKTASPDAVAAMRRFSDAFSNCSPLVLQNVEKTSEGTIQ